jgi:hypothetical protein
VFTFSCICSFHIHHAYRHRWKPFPPLLLNCGTPLLELCTSDSKTEKGLHYTYTGSSGASMMSQCWYLSFGQNLLYQLSVREFLLSCCIYICTDKEICLFLKMFQNLKINCSVDSSLGQIHYKLLIYYKRTRLDVWHSTLGHDLKFQHRNIGTFSVKSCV